LIEIKQLARRALPRVGFVVMDLQEIMPVAPPAGQSR